MEHPRWCINRKDLKEFPVTTNHFFNTFIKRRLVSAPSLGHNQAVIMQETEYTHTHTKIHSARDLFRIKVQQKQCQECKVTTA
jgi:hypothetical protein